VILGQKFEREKVFESSKVNPSQDAIREWFLFLK